MFSGSDAVDVLIEDHPGDLLVIGELLSGAYEYSRFHVAHNGVGALRFLRREGVR